jgi:photosystem II stability/assembly factor-like uncharacterized protein
MTSRRLVRRCLPIVVLFGGLSGFRITPYAAAPAGGPIDPSLYAGLRWRNIGPFRAGRVASVTGVIGQPGVFYMGLPAGGVWKTTSAGTTWFPVFDAVKEVAAVGSIQVAPSDPNVIYAGTGDLVQGGAINEGNGVYKSADAGKTWQHLPGLENTKNIPALLVDPKDPSLVVIAARGNVREKTDQRGVFRTTDGGRTWTRTLAVDDEIGAQSIAWAFDNPRVMLATTIRNYTPPGTIAARGGNGGGGRAALPPGVPSGTSLYKSTDEGATWTKLPGTGLPAMTGRTTVAIAMNTNSQRMFIIGPFGLYRSDDGGESWHQATADPRIIGTNYLNGVYVHPKNPDIVYTVGTCSYRSLDGGKTFDGYKCAPGGDDPQQLWIDPSNGDRQFLGVDQGATITLDGGQTWTSWYNQPTSQIYRISVDNSFPYWVHASQQDACAVAVRSRGELGAVTMLDWYPTPAYEFGTITADPLNPKIVYGVGWMQGIVKITYPSGQWINVAPNADTSLGLRRTGNQPLEWTATNPHELLAGYQYLMATTDGGIHWKRLSPDLGYPGAGTPPAATAPPPGGGTGAAAPTGGTISSISTSSVAAGVIWIGTSNGLIKVTRNHGLNWEDVTMPNAPQGAQVTTIDASHQDPATAYVSMDAHASGDMAPYIYRTHDAGKTWTRITAGLATNQPHGSFVRVVRTDTKRAGLLFAGTESAVYVSFDDGDNWQSLMLNLPTTAFRDMLIKDNDLVVGTYGRSIWILDDFSPLRQITAAVAAQPVHLFKPGDAYRVRRNINAGTPFPPEIPHGDNPPLGAVIYYHLGSKPTGDITLDISDAAGRVVRHMSSAPIPPYPDPPPRLPDWWLEHRKPMPTEIGTNRINWNLRYDEPPTFVHWWEHVTGAVPGDTPASPEGPLVIPGVYTLKLTVDGKSYTQQVTVKNDPRSPASAADLRAQYELQVKLYDGTRQSWEGYRQVNAMREALARVVKASPPADVATAAAAFDAKLLALAGTGIGGRGGRGAPPPPPNFTSLNGTEPEEGAVMVSMNGQLKIQDYGDMAPTETMRKGWMQGCRDMRTALTQWQGINANDLVAFNALLTKNHLEPIPAAAPPITMPVCTLGAQPAATANTSAASGREHGKGGR